MVAFHMQMEDVINGGCGYVRKSEFLLKTGPHNEVFDPKVKLSVKNFEGECFIAMTFYQQYLFILFLRPLNEVSCPKLYIWEMDGIKISVVLTLMHIRLQIFTLGDCWSPC